FAQSWRVILYQEAAVSCIICAAAPDEDTVYRIIGSPDVKNVLISVYNLCCCHGILNDTGLIRRRHASNKGDCCLKANTYKVRRHSQPCQRIGCCIVDRCLNQLKKTWWYLRRNAVYITRERPCLRLENNILHTRDL